MVKELMSDAELRRRKKLQGKISQTTGTLGLAALGGTLAASRTGRTALRKIPALGQPRGAHGKALIAKPKPLDPDRDRIRGAVTPVLATSAGLGGLGAFNFASYTNAESRKRNMVAKKPVQKNNDEPLEMGFYGDEGKPLTHQEIEAEVEKAWSPSASNFDSERNRKKRADIYSAGAVSGAGAGAAYSVRHGFKALQSGRKIKSEAMAPVTTVPAKAPVPGTPATPYQPAKKPTKANPQGTPSVKATKATPGKKGSPARLAADVKGATNAVRTTHLRPAIVHGGKAALGAAVAGGAVATGAHLKRKKAEGWQPYEKRDTTSAFGVDHRMDS